MLAKDTDTDQKNIVMKSIAIDLQKDGLKFCAKITFYKDRRKKMALALVKLSKRRNGRTYYFLDYISYDVAKIKDIQIQGEEHNDNEFSKVEIIKVIQ